MSLPQQKNLEIEALRGVAIIVTIAAHLRYLFVWHPQWFEQFAAHTALGSGLDLFFCISGFVITRSLAAHLPQERTLRSFKAFAVPFWIRRIWRLWPSAFLWLCVYLLGAAFLSAFGPLTNMIKSSIAAALQVANLYFPICVRNGTCPANLVYWSLSLEEQFYLLFPMLIFFVRRSHLVLFLAALFLGQVFLPRPNASWLWCIRTDAIASGVLLGLLSLHPRLSQIRPWSFLQRFSPVLFAVACCLLVLAGPLIGLPSYTGVDTVVAAAMVWLAGFDAGYLLRPGMLRSLLVYIGVRSYGIYLIHSAVLLATGEIWIWLRPNTIFDGDYTAAFGLTAAFLILVLAEANYRLVEDPLRRRGRKIADAYASRSTADAVAPDLRPIRIDNAKAV